MADSTRVRLTPEELSERAQRLALAVRDLERLDDEHEDTRKAMRDERTLAERVVKDLAEVVRTGVEERSVQTSLFDGGGGPAAPRPEGGEGPG